MEIQLDTAYHNPRKGEWYRLVRAPVPIRRWPDPPPGYEVQGSCSVDGPWQRRHNRPDRVQAEDVLQRMLAQSP